MWGLRSGMSRDGLTASAAPSPTARRAPLRLHLLRHLRPEGGSAPAAPGPSPAPPPTPPPRGAAPPAAPRAARPRARAAALAPQRSERERSLGLLRARRLGAARRAASIALRASLEHHTVRLGLRELDPRVVRRRARGRPRSAAARRRRRRRGRRLRLRFGQLRASSAAFASDAWRPAHQPHRRARRVAPRRRVERTRRAPAPATAAASAAGALYMSP